MVSMALKNHFIIILVHSDRIKKVKMKKSVVAIIYVNFGINRLKKFSVRLPHVFQFLVNTDHH